MAARELTVAARNYEARSLEAIAAVETMARRELQPTALPEREAEQEFIGRLTAIGSRAIRQDDIVAALRPYEPNLTTEIEQRSAILDRLRAHHAEFTAIFEHSERAGLLAKSDIARRVPPVLDLLIAQQVAAARLLQGDGRPRLLSRRSELITQINLAARSQAPQAEKEAALRELRRGWLEMEAQEAELLAATSRALLTAAATGMALRRQVVDYGRLSLAELEGITRELIGYVGAITGRDLAQLDAQVEAIAARIAADPDFSVAARRLLDEAVPPVPQTSAVTPGE